MKKSSPSSKYPPDQWSIQAATSWTAEERRKVEEIVVEERKLGKVYTIEELREKIPTKTSSQLGQVVGRERWKAGFSSGIISLKSPKVHWLSAIQESDVLVSPAHQKVLELFGKKEVSEEKGGKEWSEEEKEEEEDTKPSVVCQDASRKPKSPSGMPYDPWVFVWNDRIFVLWYRMCHLDVKEEFSVSFDSVENKVEITLKLPHWGSSYKVFTTFLQGCLLQMARSYPLSTPYKMELSYN